MDVACLRYQERMEAVKMESTAIDIPSKPTLTPQEVADLLRVSVKTIYNWRNEGRLEGFKTPGHPVRFKREIIISLMEESE